MKKKKYLEKILIQNIINKHSFEIFEAGQNHREDTIPKEFHEMDDLVEELHELEFNHNKLIRYKTRCRIFITPLKDEIKFTKSTARKFWFYINGL